MLMLGNSRKSQGPITLTVRSDENSSVDAKQIITTQATTGP
jgi:hypothetical protein